MPEALLDLVFWIAVLAAMFIFLGRRQRKRRQKSDDE